MMIFYLIVKSLDFRVLGHILNIIYHVPGSTGVMISQSFAFFVLNSIDNIMS